MASGVSNSVPKEVAFKSWLDGSEQRLMEILPPGFDNDKTHDLAIGLHGHGSDRTQFALDPRPECAAFRAFAARHDMIALSPDYRAKTSWMGPAAEADMAQIIIEAKAGLKIGRVFLIGGSMGASSALTFAALHPEMVDGVAALNGLANHVEYDNFQEFIAESFGGPKDKIPEEYRKRSAELHAEKLVMPTAFTVSGDDTVVPPGSVVRLVGKLRSLGREVLLTNRPDGGHATNFEDAMAAMEFMLSLADKITESKHRD